MSSLPDFIDGIANHWHGEHGSAQPIEAQAEEDETNAAVKMIHLVTILAS